MTELDTQLRELALTNWPAFAELIGSKAVNKAKICLMHKENRTIRYMSYRTKMALETVREQCMRCSGKKPTRKSGRR